MVGDGEEVVLRCPEGDTTMRVDLDEADETYLCPKHSLPLEKLATAGKPHRVKIIKKKSDED